MDRDELLTAARVDLLDIAAVAELFDVRPQTVRNHLCKREMPPPDLRFGQSPVWHRETLVSGAHCFAIVAGSNGRSRTAGRSTIREG